MALTRVLLFLVVANLCWAEDWVRFRGPNGSGVADGAVVEEPSLAHNLIWKTGVPPGHSSPVVVGERVYLTAVEDEKLFTLALDRKTGHVLWRRQVPRPRRSPFNGQNNAASPTPASDGQNIFVFFGEFGLLSYDSKGNERWRVPLGPFVNIRGMAASPIVVDGRLLIACDDDSGHAFLLALDATTGEEIWRADRSEFRKVFSTPAIYRPDQGPAQVLTPGSFTLVSYSFETGEELWRVGGFCWQPKAVPLIANGRVHLNCQGASADPRTGRYPSYAGALEQFDADGDGGLSEEEFYENRRAVFWEYDFSQNGSMEKDEWDFFVSRMATRPGLFAIRLGGRGDVSASHIDWVVDRPLGNVPTPLIYDGVIYSVRNAGILTSIDAQTGEIIKQGRLPDALGAYYASPVAADGRIFFLDEEGTLTVVRADRQWTVLHSLRLNEGGSATPAIVDGRLYVRTHQNLYCFGDPE
jgi:outer membrane protein assembly factor BamB